MGDAQKVRFASMMTAHADRSTERACIRVWVWDEHGEPEVHMPSL